MKFIATTLLCLTLFLLLTSWGFYAHKQINENAVYTLPTSLARFYKKHLKTITEKAVDADKRCYIDTLEGPRHYIDLDKYDEGTDSIPIHWSKAVAKFTERKLLANGMVPWQIWRTYLNLVNVLKERDYNRIIQFSADLGHYVADAHVPLHTTSNYNGQFSDQIGIHAFWETRLPEMFAHEYDYFVGAATYINDPLQLGWQIIKESNALVDSVLHIEKELSNTIKKADQKSYITRNNQLTLNYSDTYATSYHRALNGMVERRFRSSIYYVGSLLYSAWIDAGQPNLVREAGSTEPVEDKIEYTDKKILGREEWH
ncbi:zinc dependent phospholipase C family protein [Sphingobacterium lumbrici]|uniref:zinc dependent phospholipase C family protein n=1 Tax=Sphingobacterium lumbrici TaxID=2559600 RepID=UPI00112AD37D|nr:zinc dependent phospholipase C family protein [Sphingobacterium lumbrici]